MINVTINISDILVMVVTSKDGVVLFQFESLYIYILYA